MNPEYYTVVGRTENGKTVYYTGRAGKLFVSTDKNEAFSYPTLENARQRATNLNQMTELHGIRFFAPCGEVEVL